MLHCCYFLFKSNCFVRVNWLRGGGWTDYFLIAYHSTVHICSICFQEFPSSFILFSTLPRWSIFYPGFSSSLGSGWGTARMLFRVFLRVCQVHPHFLHCIWTSIFSSPVCVQRNLFLILFIQCFPRSSVTFVEYLVLWETSFVFQIVIITRNAASPNMFECLCPTLHPCPIQESLTLKFINHKSCAFNIHPTIFKVTLDWQYSWVPPNNNIPWYYFPTIFQGIPFKITVAFSYSVPCYSSPILLFTQNTHSQVPVPQHLIVPFPIIIQHTHTTQHFPTVYCTYLWQFSVVPWYDNTSSYPFHRTLTYPTVPSIDNISCYLFL